MFIVFFITATLFALGLYIYRQRNAINMPSFKIGMGMTPKNGLDMYLSKTEPTLVSSYLQTTNNMPPNARCVPAYANMELCSEIPSDTIATNVQYVKQPYVIQSQENDGKPILQGDEVMRLV